MFCRLIVIDNKERLVYKSDNNINNFRFRSNDELSTDAFIKSLDFNDLI